MRRPLAACRVEPRDPRFWAALLDFAVEQQLSVPKYVSASGHTTKPNVRVLPTPAPPSEFRNMNRSIGLSLGASLGCEFEHFTRWILREVRPPTRHVNTKNNKSKPTQKRDSESRIIPQVTSNKFLFNCPNCAYNHCTDLERSVKDVGTRGTANTHKSSYAQNFLTRGR